MPDEDKITFSKSEINYRVGKLGVLKMSDGRNSGLSGETHKSRRNSLMTSALVFLVANNIMQLKDAPSIWGISFSSQKALLYCLSVLCCYEFFMFLGRVLDDIAAFKERIITIQHPTALGSIGVPPRNWIEVIQDLEKMNTKLDQVENHIFFGDKGAAAQLEELRKEIKELPFDLNNLRLLLIADLFQREKSFYHRRVHLKINELVIPSIAFIVAFLSLAVSALRPNWLLF